MIKFIRENSKLIVKFMMTHLVMSILGIMVGLAVLTLEDGSGGFSGIAIIASLFTVGFLCFMHYDDSFFAGVKEGIKHRAEGTKPDVLKGLKIALIGYLPVILIGVVVIIVILATPEGQDHTPIPLLLFYACQGSFLSLYNLSKYVGIIGYVIITLFPSIFASFLGYAIGCKDKTIRGLFGMNVKPPFDGPLERKPKNKE
jgi:multisubunit Na+/H+ antiporter MnhB subunit